MDPIGIGIGVISLASLASTLIQGIQIIRSNDAFDRDTQILFVKLDLERETFMQWALKCGLLRKHRIDGTLFSPKTDYVIYEALKEIAILLAEAVRLQRKYLVAGSRESRGMFSNRPVEYAMDGGRIGLRRKFMFAIDGKTDINYVIGELVYFVGKVQQLVPSVEYRRAMLKEFEAMDCNAKTIRLHLADGRPHKARLRHKDGHNPAYRSTDDVLHKLDAIANEKHYEPRPEKARPRPPPPTYSQSELSYSGSRSCKKDDAYLRDSSSMQTKLSVRSRQSSGDAAREMWGDLTGRNGRRSSGYRSRR